MVDEKKLEVAAQAMVDQLKAEIRGSIEEFAILSERADKIAGILPEKQQTVILRMNRREFALLQAAIMICGVECAPEE